ncbi:type II restriction endonuclease subunit R [Methylococcaceae bacterium CS1]|nr:type II restriction endonuclease subunit R [Methylococcaceae bacterium CS4]TXK97247.1 type II restriction endonuclease subunit R [Methylococcaceae bacterium CS5]TXL03052.1 type II restriction endonuclease subunit R [Methylococcaceae bacterium CS1]TXL03998.1 type II restriction endonuclease subunit R [Methylococcaceae bacterium CS3]TXL09868.1 type II restriction endonuclease subunit R [Methylococcaceae bacterium CS2]
MKHVEWGEFNLKKLFGKSTRGKRLKSADRTPGELPFVTAGEANEGISAYIGNDVAIFSENTTTIDMFGSAKYRNYGYGGDDHIAVVHTENLPKSAAIFVTAAIHKSSHTGKFDYGRNFYAKDADELNILLPIKNGKPDFDFMENFIAELEAERIAELEAYLSAAGLKDTTLTLQEQQALEDFEDLGFEEFNVVDVFNVNNSGNILSRDIIENSGETPYLCASSKDNAVRSYISYDEGYLDKGNCIFIGGKSFVVSYQEKDFYSNDSHNLILYLKDEEKRNKLNQLFLATCVNKSLGYKYSWGDSISNRKIQKDEISLPTQNNPPYYSSMETFISAIQKLVIKDIVHYADKKIASTKQVVQS